MLKQVHFISQRQAEKLEGRPDVVVVSIHTRQYPTKLHSGFRDVLHLSFDDYDPQRDGMDALQEKFRPEHAISLKSWLEPYLHPTPNLHLVVHCYAGISRSAAVAWWAHKAHGPDLETTYPAWYLNRHVLRTLDPHIDPPERPVDAPAMPPTRDLEASPILSVYSR